jgi:hypothetical protein
VLFSDECTDNRFSKEGWALVPLLPPDEVRRLLREIEAIYPGATGPMTYANIDADRSFMYQLAELAAPIWDRYLLPRLSSHRVAFTTCVVKHPDAASGMDAHEDGTFVDERFHRSATVWLPLHDCGVGADNGTIAVLPRSHRMTGTASGSNVAEWHRDHRPFLTRHLRPVPVHEGEAVVWDSHLLHGSAPNRSDRPRFALVAEVVPATADLIHVEARSRRRRRSYTVDEGFHLEHSPIALRHAMPPLPERDRFEEEPATVDGEAIARLCGGEMPPEPTSPRPRDDWWPPEVHPSGHPPHLDHGADGVLGKLLEDCTEALLDLARTVEPAVGVGRWSGAPALRRWQGAMRSLELLPAAGERPRSHAAAVLEEAGCSHAWLLDLEPGASITPAAPPGTTWMVLLPLLTPGGDAGVASSHGCVRLEFGDPVRWVPDTSVQVYNDGHEAIPMALLAGAHPARGHRGRRRSIRSWLARVGRRGGPP